MLSFNPITGQFDLVNPAADISGKLDLTGGTVTGQLVLTGASATGALNLSPTWNNAGTNFNLVYGRATNTSSGASSKLIDVALADGSSGFVVTKAGNIQLTGTNAYRQTIIDVPGAAYGALALGLNGSVKLNITTGSVISNGVPVGSDWGGYLVLRDSGSSVTELSIKRGAGSPEGVVTANPGSIYLNSSGGPPYYKNTGTGNTGWVAADISGKLDLTGGTVTGQLVLTNASATGALNLAPTWNNAGTDFAGIYSRVTNTASGASSKLIDLGTVASGSIFSVAPDSSAAIGIHTTLTSFGLLTTTYLNGIGFVKGGSIIVAGSGNWVYLKAASAGNLVINGDNDTDVLQSLVLGSTQATTGTTVTLKAGDVTTGTGSSLTVESGVGSVANGVVNICKDYNSPLGFFNSRAAAQASTGITGATQITGTGAPVYDDDRFDGYTLAQVVAAVRSYGLLT